MAGQVAPERPGLLRFLPSLAGFALYAVFALLWFLAPRLYYALLYTADAMPNARPYGDLSAILVAGECWRQGVNVYAPNPCMGGGVYNYSPFLLRAAELGVGRQDTMQGGLLLGIACIAAFSLLPAPCAWRESWYRVIACCSGMVIYGLEAANFDAVVFLLVLCGLLLLLGNSKISLAGYAVFLFAAACKFYPVVLLGLALRESLARIALLAALVLILGAAFGLFFGHGTAAAISILPGGLPFRCVFGALNIPFGLLLLRYLPVLTLDPGGPQYFAAVGHPGAAIFVALGTKLLTLLALLRAYCIAPHYAAALSLLDARRMVFFYAGALLIVFCFFAIQNLDYRGIFLLFLLPGLWVMARETGSRRIRFLRVAVLLLLWEAFFRSLTMTGSIALLGQANAVVPEILEWLCREALWWWVAVQLSACIFVFVKSALRTVSQHFRHVQAVAKPDLGVERPSA